jgi:serine phosphatase RsbU (regulator of sigma subunit)
MYNALYTVAKRLWPELEGVSYQRRLVGTGDVAISLLTTPFAIIGLLWLILASDINSIFQAWPLYIVLGLLQLIFSRVKYFFIIELRTDRYGSAEGSLGSMLQWASLFLLGPTALWLSVIGVFGEYFRDWQSPGSKAARWNQYRSFITELTTATLSYLIAFGVYLELGGQVPIPGLSLDIVIIALLALIINSVLVFAIWAPYILYAIWVQRQVVPDASIRPILQFYIQAFGYPILAHPFAILIAGLYIENGPLVSLFFIIGLLLVAFLSRQLSWAAETSRQQARQLKELELLGREIINSPLDDSTLTSLLAEHMPVMFPSGRVIIWLSPNETLHKHPIEWEPDVEQVWQWVQTQRETRGFLSSDNLPWDKQDHAHDPVVTVPILDVENAQPIGFVYVELRSLAQPWDRKALTSLYPATQSLADHIASALFQASIYEETLDYQAALQELEFAGRIQASFLPTEMPNLEGWELAVTLLPARETSGDFFDFIPLPDERVGIMIADVADKGVGAALYMALSRTLMRTYALEYDSQPDIVFFSANERILQDARANLFVTAFYGVLDKYTGAFTYCNAGHNPPFLFKATDSGTFHALTSTGMPLGIDEDASWTQATIQIAPGDVLLLYTDGIPDAQNKDGEFFKERQVIKVAQENLGCGAQTLLTALLDAVQDFVGDAPQFDDITLLVLRRDIEPVPDDTNRSSEE